MIKLAKLKNRYNEMPFNVFLYYIFIELFFCYLLRNIHYFIVTFTNGRNNIFRVLGFKMRILPKYLGAKKDLVQFGKREFKSTDYFTNYLKSNRGKLRILDVGSNIGYYALLELFYDNFVFAFEPDKNNYDELLFNFKLNNYSDFQAFNYGLADIDGYLAFNVSQECNRSAFTDTICKTDTKRVMVRTIDSLGLDDIDCIRMDVEGFEFNVLKGSVNTLDNMKKDSMLFIEIHPLTDKMLYGNVIAFLEDHGFILVNRIVEGTEYPFFDYMNYRRLFNLDTRITPGCYECFFRKV